MEIVSSSHPFYGGYAHLRGYIEHDDPLKIYPTTARVRLMIGTSYDSQAGTVEVCAIRIVREAKAQVLESRFPRM